ncbi:hypothetical protein PEPS_30460 (plasmid) [Persicobacter psychrovividus]|uniref:Uncharacterized protein n=1 Tax=Persicobacter psychrovividus TaxID=387638 RepID=A0ABM7VIG2_9BACT|nr:hypothetical protein PEPS_30460 [Persicobacter psychrovividus]
MHYTPRMHYVKLIQNRKSEPYVARLTTEEPLSLSLFLFFQEDVSQ